jgi:hypothetical protein
MDTLVKRKISSPAGIRTPDHPSHIPAISAPVDEIQRYEKCQYTEMVRFRVQWGLYENDNETSDSIKERNILTS